MSDCRVNKRNEKKSTGQSSVFAIIMNRIESKHRAVEENKERDYNGMVVIN